MGSPPACSPSGSALPGQPGPGSASTWSPPEVPAPPDASPCVFVDPDLKSNLGKVPEHCLSRYSLLLPASGQTWGDGGDHSVEDARSLTCAEAVAQPRKLLPPPPLPMESGEPKVWAGAGSPKAEPRPWHSAPGWPPRHRAVPALAARSRHVAWRFRVQKDSRNSEYLYLNTGTKQEVSPRGNGGPSPVCKFTPLQPSQPPPQALPAEDGKYLGQRGNDEVTKHSPTRMAPRAAEGKAGSTGVRKGPRAGSPGSRFHLGNREKDTKFSANKGPERRKRGARGEAFGEGSGGGGRDPRAEGGPPRSAQNLLEPNSTALSSPFPETPNLLSVNSHAAGTVR